MPSQREPKAWEIFTWHLPSGYWEAEIRVPYDDGDGCYEQVASGFHDEREAQEWAEQMVAFIAADWKAA